MSIEITSWLRGLGLEQYASAFRDNAIDAEVLRELRADDLRSDVGCPRAHEDDAERAVRAGLGLIDAVARLDVKSVTLQARVGIATGLVVVGDLIGEGSAQEQSVVGETPNLAARLQALAEPDAVVIAAATRRSLRVRRSRPRRGQGHRRAGAGLAGAASERRREPLRGTAR